MDSAPLAATASPGVADAAQPVAAQVGRGLAQPDGAHGNGMDHHRQYRAYRAERQCVACGVVGECDPSQPCVTCGASSFHLIPLRPPAA